MFQIICINSPYIQSHMYICLDGKNAIIIDPFPYEAFEKEFGEVKVDYILLTHEHYDHISGVNYFRGMFDCKVLCSEECAKRILSEKDNLSAYFDVLMSIPGFSDLADINLAVEPYTCKADMTFLEDSTLQWQGHTVDLIATPGHTLGSACFLFDRESLFSGDTLFATIETMTRFPNGSGRLFKTITMSKLNKLPRDVDVYPGHYQNFKLKDRLPNDAEGDRNG